MFKEYDVVKIGQLLLDHRPFEGSKSVSRPPQVGDVGMIVHVGENTSGKTYYIEMVDSQGYTIWLADFLPEELLPI
jgi:hypothetical protein